MNKGNKQIEWLNSQTPDDTAFLVKYIANDWFRKDVSMGVIGSTNINVKSSEIIIGRKILFKLDAAQKLDNDMYAIKEEDIVSYGDL
jgi:hypothetical protein